MDNEDILSEMIENKEAMSFNNIKEWENNINGFNIKNEGFTCMHINIRSIRKNWDIFLCITMSVLKLIDVIILTEINIIELESELYNLSGYNKYVKCRVNRKGGGIMVFIRKEIMMNKIENELKECEAMTFKYVCKNRLRYILCIYRPPNGNKTLFIDSLDRWLKIYSKNELLLMGDINIDLNNYNDNMVIKYTDLMLKYNMKCLIDVSTREEYVGEVIKSSCIDHINSNLKCCIISAVIKQKIADHYITMISIGNKEKLKLELECNKQKDKRIYMDNNLIKKQIKIIDWNSIKEIQDVDEMYNEFVSKFNNIYKKAEIEKTNRKIRNKNAPWMNLEIKKKIEEKNTIWKKCIKEKNNLELQIKYKNSRNKVNIAIRKQKRKYYYESFENIKDDMKKTWYKISELINYKNNKNMNKIISENFTEGDDFKTAEDFNRSFIEQINKLKSKSKEQESRYNKEENGQIPMSLYIPEINKEDIRQIIKGFNKNMSPGFDKIRMKDLEDSFEILSDTIMHILNKIINTGKVPELLKIAKIKPVFKSGDKKLYQNYRPISILSSISKILEKYMGNTIKGFLEKNNYFYKNQYGFREKKSTTDLLEKFAEIVNKALDENKFVFIIFMDIKKAFDLIDHKRLIDRMEKCGVRGVSSIFFKDFFKNRCNVVEIRNVMSKKQRCEWGNPQGSSLSSLLYLIYTNDIKDIKTDSHILCYADDIAIMSVHRDKKEALRKLQNDFNKIVIWCRNKELIINSTKTKMMIIHNKKIKIKENIIIHSEKCMMEREICDHGCVTLEQVKKIKYLGMYVDDKFLWREHIMVLNKKFKYFIYMFYKIEDLLPQRILLMIYKTVCESILRYGITVYGLASKSELKRLKNYQQRIFKILGMEKVGENREILNFDQLKNYVIIVKNYFCNEYKEIKNNKYNMRNNREIYNKPRINNKYGNRIKKSYIPDVFNKLPDNLKWLESMGKMKKLVKEYIRSV